MKGLSSKQESAQMNSLVEKRDMLILEAVSRTLGHTDWGYDDKRMRTRKYPDGSAVFSFDGKDMLLFEPPFLLDGKLTQPVQFLYDKTDFKYMTPEERFDRGLIPKPVENDDD